MAVNRSFYGGGNEQPFKMAWLFQYCSMLLGAHVSIGGGYLNALTEAKRLGCDAIQIFTKNQRFWKEREVSPDEGNLFRSAMKSHGVKQAFSHAIYLISLGSDDMQIIEKSVLSLAMELQRCHTLGLTHTVLHPGSAGKRSMQDGINRIGDHLKAVLDATDNNPAKILIENTAGGGTSVGGRLENIGALLNYIGSDRVGVCIDTCHAFAAGYDIRTKKGMKDFVDQVDKHIGMERLLCFHLNDSKGALGSKIDRHAGIGEGLLGLEPFEFVMKNFPKIPKVIETPKENDADVKNLAVLRGMAKKK